MKMNTVLFVKNMVCPRCIKVITDELQKINIVLQEVKLGHIELNNTPSVNDLESIKKVLNTNGFELLEDKKIILIERVKNEIIQGIQDGSLFNIEINLSKYISDIVNLEYTHFSSLFSTIEGKSIEKFVILQKIERIKELISYDELSIKQIADKLGYSSLQALSNQFKKETGITPSDFKKFNSNSIRKSISDI